MTNAAIKPDQAGAASCTYGSSHTQAWTQSAEGVSLVRRTPKARPMLVPARPENVQIDLSRSALVVIDMQNDFCHPDGWFGQKGISVRPMRKPIPLLNRLLPAWRKAAGQVIWLNWGVRADLRNLSPTILYHGKRRADAVGYGECSARDHGPAVVAGSWGAQIVDELSVDEADIQVYKHRLSGFWDNELDSILRQQGITTLLFAGVNTDRCVFSTLQDAAFLGYDCVLLSDACSTPSAAYVTRAIHFLVQQLHGFVAEGSALLTALSAGPAKGRASRFPSTNQEKS